MLDVMTIGVSGALLAVMLSAFFEPGMIFAFYGEWLEDKGWWAKPLGQCLTCFTVWCVVLMGIVYIWVYPVWVVLASLSVGHLTLGVIDRLELL